MVVRNKLYRLFDRYRKVLKKRYEKDKNGQTLKSYKSKNTALDFYLKNNRWPSRLAGRKEERSLAQKFENYVSKESHMYDPQFRRLAFVTGRKANNKRKHNIDGFKKEILEFLEKHGRVPSSSYEYQANEGEARLRNRLDYYTLGKNDTTFLGKVYELDKCHRSGIPSKYRPIINKALDVEKPLLRLV